MINKVTVKGIRAYAYHGCLDEETAIGGEFLIDVVVDCMFKDAAEKDDLSLTVDYVEINQIVEEEMAKSAKLIETIGYNIVGRVKKINHTIKSVFVEIKKINPPINGDVQYVSIIVQD